MLSNIRCSSFQDSSNSRRKDLERVRTNTQVSDMRIWHVDTSARLSAKGARGLGDLCYARTEVERRAHEMQTFLHELRKLKKCQRTLDTNIPQIHVAKKQAIRYTVVTMITKARNGGNHERNKTKC